MDQVHRHVIRSSINDTVHILDSAPVKLDLVPQFTAFQMMNRAPIAHLSVERGLKSLIADSGVHTKDEHNLLPLYRKLAEFNPEDAAFFSKSFDDAVRAYGYKVNSTGLEHLKSIEAYLSKVGSQKAFNAMRYWEIKQSLDEDVLRRISLPIHRELLLALCQLFMPSSQRTTVIGRIERRVKDAMFDPPKLAYAPGSEKENVVKWYLNWLFQEHSTCCDALADAVNAGFWVRDDFIDQLLFNAYNALLKCDDPAVQHFAYSLNVLPPQPRDPGQATHVEWLGPSTEPRSGLVSSPAGTLLGEIARRAEGRWEITPYRGGALRVSAIALSQTDARCYLANHLTQEVIVAVNGSEARQLRLVGEGDLPFLLNASQHMDESSGNAFSTFVLDFWDEAHGLEQGQHILVESGPTPWQSVDVVEGDVVDVDRQRVSIRGAQSVRALADSGTEARQQHPVSEYVPDQ